MSKTTVDGFTYSDQRFARQAMKATKILQRFLISRRTSGHIPVPFYNSGTQGKRLGINVMSQTLDLALKLDNMSGRAITKKAQREYN